MVIMESSVACIPAKAAIALIERVLNGGERDMESTSMLERTGSVARKEGPRTHTNERRVLVKHFFP